MKQVFLLLVITVAVATAMAQHRKTENLIIVTTLGGLRWQELFRGIRQKFWAEAGEERRQKLFPFFVAGWWPGRGGARIFEGIQTQSAVYCFW